MLSLLAADGVHAQPAQKAPAAMIVGSAEKRPTPGQEKTFIARTLLLTGETLDDRFGVVEAAWVAKAGYVSARGDRAGSSQAGGRWRRGRLPAPLRPESSGRSPDASDIAVAQDRRMRIALKNRINRRRVKRASIEAAQTLSVVSQMALLCPSGMDVWMQRELAGSFELPRHGAAPKR
jgi:hypothetical protein